MHLLRSVSAALLALSTLVPAQSFAAPPSAPLAADDGLVVQVSGCHRDPQRHFVPEFGRRAWHIHRGRSCRPVEVDGPGFGDGPGGGVRDCHRDVQRHRLPGIGRVFHRHVGRSCRVEIFDEFDRPRPGNRPGACVNIGGATVCLRP